MHNFTSGYTPVHATYDRAHRAAKQQHAIFSGDMIYRTTLTSLKERYELPGADAEIETLDIFTGRGIDAALRHWSDVLATYNQVEVQS